MIKKNNIYTFRKILSNITSMYEKKKCNMCIYIFLLHLIKKSFLLLPYHPFFNIPPMYIIQTLSGIYITYHIRKSCFIFY